MKNRNTRTPAKSFLLCVLAVASVGFASGEARADEVFIVGQTSGCFGTPCTPALNTGGGGLLFQGSVFGGVTQNGFRAVGGSQAGSQQSSFNNLGLFTLGNVDATYDGTQFTLRVLFSAPQGFVGLNGALLSATLTGSVRATPNNDAGGVFLDFDNTPLLFTFADTNCESFPVLAIPGQQITCGTGSFFFSVNDLAIDPGHTAALSGQFTGAQQTSVPEPATLLLLGTGLAGFAARARARMRRTR